MFPNFTLTTELARQHQSDMLIRSERRRWFHHSTLNTVAAPATVSVDGTSCPVVELPAPRVHAAQDDALVA